MSEGTSSVLLGRMRVTHKGNERRDQLSMQAAQSILAVAIFHHEGDALFGDALRHDGNAFLRQGSAGPGRTHGIHAKARTDTRTHRDLALTANPPVSHVVLQE